MMVHKLQDEVCRLAKEGKIGWLCRDGEFFDAPNVGEQVFGLNLGQHESGALEILRSTRPDLFAELDKRRIKLRCRTWPETSCHNLIKRFMKEHGYIRVHEDILDIADYMD